MSSGVLEAVAECGGDAALVARAVLSPDGDLSVEALPETELPEVVAACLSRALAPVAADACPPEEGDTLEATVCVMPER